MLYSFVKTNPRRMFFFDGCGALLSMLLLVTVANFEQYIGMPKEMIYRLLPVSVLLAVYSFSCYLLNPQDLSPFLKIISIANTTYCLVTLLLCFYFWSEVTILGKAYFFGEVMVVMYFAGVEWKVS